MRRDWTWEQRRDNALRDAKLRSEELEGFEPACPSCGTKQVKLMSRKTPAAWRCKHCLDWFEAEPTA